MLNRREGFGVARAVVLSAAALGVLIPACASDKMGTVGEDCYPNGTCNETLVCKAGKCVADSGGNGGAGGQGTTSSSSSSSTTSSSTTSSGGSTTSSSGTGGSTTGSSSSSSSSSSGTGGGTTSSSSSSSSSSTTSSTSGAPANMPPQILVFGTNVQSLTEGESVTFTAVVTDPDGIDDVIGGTLSDGNGHYYGAFATTGQEGAYALTVSWAQIDQLQAINLNTNVTSTRNFEVEFYDQAGHSVQQATTVTVTCKGVAGCDGHCTDLSKDVQNCGTCGHACAAGVACFKGQCAALSQCSYPPNSTCNLVCSTVGKTCADLCNGGIGGITYGTTTCGGTASNVYCSTSLPTSGVKCCCF